MKVNLRLIIIAIIAFVTITAIYLFVAHKVAKAPNQDLNQKTSSQVSPTPPQFKGEDEVLKNALNLYIAKKQQGIDFTDGPCLGKIADDWVLDIAHNPRQPVDDRAQNQCADLREGNAHHFIELDESGDLIRSL